MERGVNLAVDAAIFDHELAFSEQLVPCLQGVLDLDHCFVRQTHLRRALSRQPFKNRPDLVRFYNVVNAKFAYMISAIGNVDEQPFPCERLQRRANRRPRHLEQFG